MFETIAAIDVGSSSIKIVTVKTGFRDFQIKSLAYQDIDFEINDRQEALQDALSKILQDEDIRNLKIVTNLPMEKAIIRNISFPFNDVEKIADAIPFEAEENIPFKLDDLILDFQSLKSEKENEGRILLAAAHKENLYNFLNFLHEQNIHPIHMGMESNALYECYKYFNKIEDETVIQLDLGYKKTIINLIKNNSLLYTRSIAIGIDEIYIDMADSLKMNLYEAIRIFNNLNLDLTSEDNNLQREYYKNLGLSKQKLKKIYTIARGVVEELIEQIFLTTKALFIDFGQVSYNRILISGGGSNILGIGTMISQEFNVPVVAQPFLDNYSEKEVTTQFPIVFGTILSYLNSKRSTVNFLKGEFIPDVASSTKKIYYLSGGFGILTIIIVIVNLVLSFILSSKTNKQYEEMLQKQFKKYFRKQASGDPIDEANKLLKKERKEMAGISAIMPDDTQTLDVMRDILTFFPADSNFNLRNMVFNKRVIRIDGTIGSSTQIDSFKEKLIQSKKFDSVTLNIKDSRKDEIRFSMNIKQKLPSSVKKKDR